MHASKQKIVRLEDVLDFGRMSKEQPKTSGKKVTTYCHICYRKQQFLKFNFC